MQRADWFDTSWRRYSSLPTVTLDADRLISTVAPASAASDEGGIGVHRSSQISTKKREQRLLFDLEQQARAERDVALTAQVDRVAGGVVAGRELAQLVELAVVRQVGLGRDPEDSPARMTAAQL